MGPRKRPNLPTRLGFLLRMASGLYAFDWKAPVLGGRLNAFHAIDVPFVFETIDIGGFSDRGKVACDLSGRIAATWTAFARKRQTRQPAIPHWPATDRATLVLDRQCRVESDYGREMRMLWKEIAGV